MSFNVSYEDENKLLIDFFALLLEWETDDEQKNNEERTQKVQTTI